jgi:hypothetical protein
MRRLAIAVVSFAGLAALAGTAAADAPHRPTPTWTVDAGAHYRWWTYDSAEALAPETMASQHVAIGRKLARANRRAWAGLEAFVRFGDGDARGSLFQTLGTHISQTTLTAGVRMSLPVRRWLHFVALGETGAARTAVTIGDELGAMAPVDDAAWAPLGIVTVGLEVAAVQRRQFYLAARLELGTVIAEPVSIRARPRTRPEPDLSIPTEYAGLGELDTGGNTIGLAIRAGF